MNVDIDLSVVSRSLKVPVTLQRVHKVTNKFMIVLSLCLTYCTEVCAYIARAMVRTAGGSVIIKAGTKLY
jgi:hypothetical protein